MTFMAVDEDLGVSAGMFTTIPTQWVSTDGAVKNRADSETGIVVKNEIRDGQNVLVFITELISLN